MPQQPPARLLGHTEDGVITATTRKTYVGQVNNHIICYPEWGSLGELSGAKVRNWQTWLRANGRTANTRKAALAVLKTALQKAWKFELIPTNPARLVDLPRVRRQRREEITVGVDPVAVRQLSGHKSEEMTDVYTTRLDSRMRAAVERLATQIG